MTPTQLATADVYDITLGGFVVVAVLAVVIVWLGRTDRSRIIRFGFFLEHKREQDDEEEGVTSIWPGERGEKEREE